MAHNSTLFDPVERAIFGPKQAAIQHDTFEITKLYLQRPFCLATLKLSLWFCQAHGIEDWNLVNAASLGDCKQQLIDKRYVFLPLEPLIEFNKKWEKQKVYLDKNKHETTSNSQES